MSGNNRNNYSSNTLNNSSDKVIKVKERRKKADWLVNLSIFMSALAWIVVFAVWCVVYVAAENKAGIFNVFLNVDVPANPLTQTLLPVGFGLLLLSIVICIFAFIFNMLRMKRKTDKYRKSIIIISIITVVALIAYLMNFGSSFLW